MIMSRVRRRKISRPPLALRFLKFVGRAYGISPTMSDAETRQAIHEAIADRALDFRSRSL